MASSASVTVVVPETPQRPFVHPELTTTQQKYLSSIGLHKKAQRLADIEQICQWYKSSEDNSDAWREQVFTSMMRTEPYYAERRALNHEMQYSSFVNHMPTGWFTNAVFYFYSEWTTLNDPQHEENQRIVRHIREMIAKLGVKAIDKYVAFDGTLPKKKAGSEERNRSLKVIFSEVIPPEKIHALIKGLPSHVVIKARTEHKNHFTCALHTWSRAGYLGNVKERADMELSLDGLQQVVPHGFSPEERSQFALGKKYDAILPQTFDDLETMLLPDPHKKGEKYIPRSPKTGKPARFVSIVVNREVKVDDLAPEEWSELSPPE